MNNNEQQTELIPLQLGEMLQLAREKKGLALEAAARETKMRAEVLSSIESGETEHIPSVYLKGYIRNYAKFLGVPAETIETRMPQARGSEPGVQSVFKESLPRNSSERWIKASSYVLASAVVIALVWQFTNEAVRFSQGDPLLRAAQGENPQKSATGSNEAAQESNTQSAETHLRASIASMNVGTESSTARRPVSASGAWAAINDPAAASPGSASIASGTAGQADLNSISIVTSADSWVEIIDGSGQKIEMDLLRAGNRRNYSGSGPFQLLLGRASSVEVFQNGAKVDLGPYTRGNVARLTLGGDEAPLPESAAPESAAPQPDGVVPEQATATENPADQG